MMITINIMACKTSVALSAENSFATNAKMKSGINV